jgi:DNA-binding NarL/FixJ family response regulator
MTFSRQGALSDSGKEGDALTVVAADDARSVPDGVGKSGADCRDAPQIVIIEKRSLNRECLRDCMARCLASVAGSNVVAFASVEAWLGAGEPTRRTLLVLCSPEEPKDNHDLALAAPLADRVTTIVMSDIEDAEQIVRALDGGARGYIPTSLPLEVAIGAIQLVLAGGVFVPASSLRAARRPDTPMSAPHKKAFTARQTAVVKALGMGKANKVIAYELNMRESTVKVHVRNIMKKLSAKNRTQVALMASKLIDADADTLAGAC